MIRWILTVVVGIIIAAVWDKSDLGHAWYGVILAWFILYLCHPGYGQERSGCVHPVKAAGANLTGLLSAFLYGLVIAGGYPSKGYFEEQKHNMDIHTTGIVSWVPNLAVGFGRMLATKEVQDEIKKEWQEHLEQTDPWGVEELRKKVTTVEQYQELRNTVDQNILRLETYIKDRERFEAELKAAYEAGEWDNDEDGLKSVLYKLYYELEEYRLFLASWKKSAINLEAVRSEKGF